MYKMAGKRAGGKRRGGKRMGRRPARRPARRLDSIEYASCKQSLSLVNDSMNMVFRLDDINLSQFDRATQIARAYQYFRISKVELQFKPFMDTFTNGTVQSVPYLYYLLMKGDNIDVGTFNQLRDAGAKPIRFDDKTIKVNWRPFVSQGVIGEDSPLPVNPSLTAWAMTKRSPWLATSYLPSSEAVAWTPSKVPHKGILYGVQQDSSTITQYYEVSITVHFQFKKPLVQVGGGGALVPSVPKQVIDKEDAALLTKETPPTA